MKKYIFITHDIDTVGGIQQYTAGKITYLLRNGWVPVCIYSKELVTDHKPLSIFADVNCTPIVGLAIQPNMFSTRMKNRILCDMMTAVGEYSEGDELIVESQEDVLALWGELLAKKIRAKHVIFDCSEQYDLPYNCYLPNIEFFKFKFCRKEFAVMNAGFDYGLFDGVMELKPEDIVLFTPEHLSPVQDVENEAVNNIQRLDLNICYVGRGNKPYVSNIVEDVCNLAKAHPDKRIQLIVFDTLDKFVNDAISSNYKNLTVTALGRLTPIPRKLYSKVDAVIAGSGSAVCSAYEGVPVIIPDSDNYMADGIYGIDTFDVLRHEEGLTQTSYDTVLENLLLYHKYDDKEIMLPFRKTADQCYEEQMGIVSRSSRDVEYYTNFPDFRYSERLKMTVRYVKQKYFTPIIIAKRKLFAVIKEHFPFVIKIKRKVVLLFKH